MSSTPPSPYEKQRRYQRFAPDVSVYADIDPNMDDPRFKPTFKALVFSESYGGCGLVALKRHNLKLGQKVKVVVGNLSAVVGEVKWLTEIDEDICKLGIQYSA